MLYFLNGMETKPRIFGRTNNKIVTKIYVAILALFVMPIMAGCGERTLSKQEATGILAPLIKAKTMFNRVNFKATTELSALLEEYVKEGKIKKVSYFPNWETAAVIPMQGMFMANIPTLKEEFGEVISILNDAKAGTATAEFTIVSTPNEPYYSAFRRYSSEIRDTPMTRKGSATFKRFEEGWRLVGRPQF